jgi:hypothetical protein
MEIWEPKPPGTLWATPGLLWDLKKTLILTQYSSLQVRKPEIQMTSTVYRFRMRKTIKMNIMEHKKYSVIITQKCYHELH